MPRILGIKVKTKTATKPKSSGKDLHKKVQRAAAGMIAADLSERIGGSRVRPTTVAALIMKDTGAGRVHL